MNNSDTNQAEQLNETAVKCRFFAQYWGTKTMYVGGVGLVEIGNAAIMSRKARTILLLICCLLMRV